MNFRCFFIFCVEFCIFLRICYEFFSGFRAKFQKRVTSVAFQSILRKQIRKLPKILKSVKIIQYYSIIFSFFNHPLFLNLLFKQILIQYYSILFIRVLIRYTWERSRGNLLAQIAPPSPQQHGVPASARWTIFPQHRQQPELKCSIGEGPNPSNFSDQSSVKILAKFRNFRQKIKKFRKFQISTCSKISAKFRQNFIKIWAKFHEQNSNQWKWSNFAKFCRKMQKKFDDFFLK